MSCKDCRRLPVVALALSLALIAAGCGKRGAPRPPITYIPTTTEDLEIQQLGNELLLTLSYPTTTTSGLTLGGLFALHIYELDLPVSVDDPEMEMEGEDSTEDKDPDESEVVGTQEADDEPEPDPETEDEPTTEEQEPVDSTDPTEEQAEEDAEEEEEDRPEVDRRAFVGAATLRVAIEEIELATLTSGERIGVRLPIQPQEDGRVSLLAFAVRTVSLQQQQSQFSNVVSIVPRPPIDGPSALELQALKQGVEVSWISERSDAPTDDVLGYNVLGYNVYRRLAADRLYSQPIGTVGPDERSFLDVTALYENRYIYTVRIVAGSEPTIESGIASEREIEYRDVFAPEPPRRVELLPEDGRIRLLWAGSPDSDLVGYFVYRRDAGGEFRRVVDDPLAVTEHLDQGLTGGLSYTYRVTAVDGNGNESSPSEESSANAR